MRHDSVTDFKECRQVPSRHHVPLPQCITVLNNAASAVHDVSGGVTVQGVQLFRVPRHTGFLRQMLHTFSQVYTNYVKRNFYSSLHASGSCTLLSMSMTV
ncbi:hypothetical protein ABBQ38_001887 [Trebouxia sp. C0009 RCD-2024]